MSRDVASRAVAVMGTIVTIQVVGRGHAGHPAADQEDSIERAFGWFHRIEQCCSRFDSGSEARQLTSQIGVAIHASEILFEAVQFAVSVSEESRGAFDPTVGHRMETRGFNRHYRTGQLVTTPIDPDGPVSYRDLALDPERKTITVWRPLILDLGAVAKGLAIDMAARELRPFGDYAIDAGGDLYVAGLGPHGAPWSVGIRHPRLEDQLIDSLSVSDLAVCTSGDYERRSPQQEHGHHIVDPRSGRQADAVASATVVAPTAMLADALATAAFVLGPSEGLALLERQGVDGLIVSPALEQYATPGLSKYLRQSSHKACIIPGI